MIDFNESLKAAAPSLVAGIATIGTIVAVIDRIRSSKVQQEISKERVALAEKEAEGRVALAERDADKRVALAETELEYFKEHLPDKTYERFDKIRQVEKEYIVELERELAKRSDEIQAKAQEIIKLKEEASFKHERLTELEETLSLTKKQADYLDRELQNLLKRDLEMNTAIRVAKRADFDMEFVKQQLEYLEMEKRYAMSLGRRGLSANQAARQQQQQKAAEAARQLQLRQEDAAHARQYLERKLDE